MNPNLFFFLPEIFVKQDEPLRKIDASVYGFWLFSSVNSFCICLTIRRVKFTQQIGPLGKIWLSLQSALHDEMELFTM
jgi:hypothetical protein